MLYFHTEGDLMRKRKVAVPGLLAAMVAFAGACSDVAPTEPIAAVPTAADMFRAPAMNPNAELEGTLDAAFVRIAQDVPGFGGLFYDEAGVLTVYMTDVAQARSADMATVIRTHLPSLQLDAGTVQQARVRQGQYDFIQLNTMYRQVRPVHAIGGVVFSDADEAANRVRIGVENATAEQDVRNALAMLGVPSEAVIIEITEPIVPMQTLQSMVRPVAGGLQINFTRGDPPSGFVCTLGFNVRSPNAPNVHGFVTNSHCSDTRGVVVPTPYWQHNRAVAGTFIAWEAWDAPFFTGGICPAGRRCRYSDALGARYETGIDNLFGAIYKTTEPGQHSPAPLTIDPVNPRWQITSETPFALVGQTAHKSGRTTGWLVGPVINSCQTTTTSPDLTIFCQDRVQATPQGGDSGSPVFFRQGETLDVSLVGILWGGSSNTYVFSPMYNVRCENQHPQAPWITFPGQTPPAAAPCAR
jgi:hypothetical protein